MEVTLAVQISIDSAMIIACFYHRDFLVFHVSSTVPAAGRPTATVYPKTINRALTLDNLALADLMVRLDLLSGACIVADMLIWWPQTFLSVKIEAVERCNRKVVSLATGGRSEPDLRLIHDFDTVSSGCWRETFRRRLFADQLRRLGDSPRWVISF